MNTYYSENFQLPPRELPNASMILALGIISIPMACCNGFPSLICAIIALVLANEAEKKYKLYPDLYIQSSLENVKVGKICAIIGICLSAIMVIAIIAFYIFYFAVLFATAN